ncbi:MAG TPA: SRPBCC family protein [Gemmatimonadales bacterium]|nr:SRPBCC family protein [Gemmatimonadales bacterium]
MTTATYTSDPGMAGEWGQEGNGTHERADGERLAKALGVFSVGLGLAQVLAPRGVARAIGVEDDDDNRKTMFAIGLREIATGVGLLSQRRPATFAWGRVTGDAMDLALLGRAFRSDRTDQNRLAAATAAVLGVTVLDVIAGQRLSRPESRAVLERRRERGIRVRKAITINRSPEEIYRFWRNFENLPVFMSHLESVRQLDDRRSYWKARAPLGATVEWTAELVEDRPNELIAWRSVEDADVTNSGRVRFTPAPRGRGTEVQVELSYEPPAGVIGATIAKLFGEEPSQQVDGDLRRFKQVMEVGEVVHSDASIHRGAHPAQPSEELPSNVLSPTATGGQP